jgi:hypothetical protein
MTTSQGVNWIRGTRRPTASVGDTNSKVVPGLIADSTSRSTRRTNLGWVKFANGSVAVSPAARYRRPEQWSLVICAIQCGIRLTACRGRSTLAEGLWRMAGGAGRPDLVDRLRQHVTWPCRSNPCTT